MDNILNAFIEDTEYATPTKAQWETEYEEYLLSQLDQE